MKEYNGKVRVVFKNMVVHPQVVQKAHLASCAASKQGKFSEFKRDWWDKAFGAYQSSHDQSKLGDDNIMKIASDLHLDMTKFKADIDGDDCKARVQGDMQELSKFHVNSTPTFFINGTHLGGALPKDSFKELIDKKLKDVEASGVPCPDYYDKEVMGKGEKQFRSKKDPKPS